MGVALSRGEAAGVLTTTTSCTFRLQEFLDSEVRQRHPSSFAVAVSVARSVFPPLGSRLSALRLYFSSFA
jgi:hypothetical protein